MASLRDDNGRYLRERYRSPHSPSVEIAEAIEVAPAIAELLYQSKIAMDNLIDRPTLPLIRDLDQFAQQSLEGV